MASTMTLSGKGQFTFNQELMGHLGVKAGEKVVVKKLPDGSLNVAAEKNQLNILSLAGSLKGCIKLTDEQLDESIAQSYIQRGMRGL